LYLEQEATIRQLTERIQFLQQQNEGLQIATTRLATELNQAQNAILHMLGTRQMESGQLFQNVPVVPQHHLILPSAAHANGMDADLGYIRALPGTNLFYNGQNQVIGSAAINQPVGHQGAAHYLRVPENLGAATQSGDLPPLYRSSAGLVHGFVQPNPNAASFPSPLAAYLGVIGAGAVHPLAMVRFLSTAEQRNSVCLEHLYVVACERI
jgi:hypothetical protein